MAARLHLALFLMKTSLLLPCKSSCSSCGSVFCIKERSPLASLAFIGLPVTKMVCIFSFSAFYIQETA